MYTLWSYSRQNILQEKHLHFIKQIYNFLLQPQYTFKFLKSVKKLGNNCHMFFFCIF